MGGEAGLELVAHRIVAALDAALAGTVARVEVVRRDQDEQNRRGVQRRDDDVAPAATRGQVVLVEEDLVFAEQRVEVSGERRRLVDAVAGAVADEDPCGHRAEALSRMRECGAICDSASTPKITTWTPLANRFSWSVPATPPAARSRGASRAKAWSPASRGAAPTSSSRCSRRFGPSGGEAHGFASDARKEAEVETLVARIEREIAPIEVAVFNIGANVRFSVVETTERVYRKVWEMGALAGFLMGREVAKAMLARGHGTILFTGATASLRGSAGFVAFAGAKHALRALAQSMARELGPKGIHVAHVVIDGAIDTQFIAENFPERYALKDKDGILAPDAIAENYWNLHCQAKSAWTHELDLRPWLESW